MKRGHKKVQIVRNARKEKKMWERKLASGISQLAFIKVCQIPLALFPTRRTSYCFLLFFLWITCLFHLLHLLSFSKQTFCYTKIKNFKKGKMQNCEPITVDNSFALWRQVFALSKYWKFVQTKTHNFSPNIPPSLNRILPVEGKTNITTSSKLHRWSDVWKQVFAFTNKRTDGDNSINSFWVKAFLGALAGCGKDRNLLRLLTILETMTNNNRVGSNVDLFCNPFCTFWPELTWPDS